MTGSGRTMAGICTSRMAGRWPARMAGRRRGVGGGGWGMGGWSRRGLLL